MMAEDKFAFNLVSVNARGLNDRKKRRNLFRWVKRNKFDICLVQETYSTKETENCWTNEWGGKIIFSHGSRHSRGVMTLIKPGFDAKVIDVSADNIGRLLMVDVMIQDVKFKIINIYAPNHEDDQINFYRHLRRQINVKTENGDNILMAGDWNFIINPVLDRKGGVPIKPSIKRGKILQYLNDIKEEGQLKDIWRVKNPLTKRFTWRRNNPMVKSRLDYWIISDHLEDHTKETDIIPFQNTDHSAVILKLDSVKDMGKGRGLWRLNTSFLKEEPYIRTIIETKIKWADEFKDVTDPRVKWELMKYRIRQASMKYGKLKAQTMKRNEQDLEDRLKILEEKYDMAEGIRESELQKQILEIKTQLQEITDYKTQGLILRSQTNWYEKGEKSTKYFLQMESRNKIKKSIKKLQRIDGSFTTCEKEILAMQEQFYKNLYSAKHIKTPEEMSTYVRGVTVPNLSEEEKSSCEGPLLAEECLATLKDFKPNKSPGNDGLPIEFYLKFWPLFGQIAVESFNYAHDCGELSVSQRQATITLLDKGKDRNQLKNWRPISLLNSDYKIMTKSLANRFLKYLPKIIQEDQTGFVKGRNISENIRTISDILEYLKDNDLPGILISIDFEKAFDSLDWNFMLMTLKKFNFGPSFIRWIKILYSNISSCIINNGHTSRFFPVHRGVRQGDPLSPYLFILVAEIMASKIRQNQEIIGLKIKDNEYKLMQYADDTTGLLHDLKSAASFLNTVKEFGQYSGLNLNIEKTEAMWLGSSRLKATKPLGITWPDRPIRILGIFFSYDEAACEQCNYIDRIDKANRIVNSCMGRNLTMYGRSQIIRTFILSQFTYTASSISVPEKVIKMVNKLIFRFMWRNKKERLRRVVLMNPINNGGMKVPDFQTMLNASRIKWVSKIQDRADAAWKNILADYLAKCGIRLELLLFSNFSMKSLGLNTCVLPCFYKELLQLWSEVGNVTQVEKQRFLWYNREICVNKRSLYYEDLFAAGAWYINDLYEQDGTPVTFEKWVSRGVNKHSLIKWMGLIKKTTHMRVNRVNNNYDEALELALLSKGALSHLNSKLIYEEMLAKKIGHTVCIPRIAKYVDTENVDWKEIYIRANKAPRDTKTKEFQYKFLHDLLSNRYWLCKWNLSDNEFCTHCGNGNSNVETIQHMFWDCESMTNFWRQFEDFLRLNGQSIRLNKEKVFLGVSDTFVSKIIFTAKMYIYNKRIHNEPVHILGFKGYIASLKRMEYLIAKENDMVDVWNETWADTSIETG